VKIGIKADTGIMLLKPATVSAVVNVVGIWFQSVIDLGKLKKINGEKPAMSVTGTTIQAL
jgi:hypothetical protein